MHKSKHSDIEQCIVCVWSIFYLLSTC